MAHVGKKKRKGPIGFSKAEGQQEDGTNQLRSQRVSQQAPTPQTNTSESTNGLLSHKVWALFKGLLLCWGLGW